MTPPTDNHIALVQRFLQNHLFLSTKQDSERRLPTPTQFCHFVGSITDSKMVSNFRAVCLATEINQLLSQSDTAEHEKATELSRELTLSLREPEGVAAELSHLVHEPARMNTTPSQTAVPDSLRKTRDRPWLIPTNRRTPGFNHLERISHDFRRPCSEIY